MKYRFLGTTGLRVSTLSLGTMSFGTEADEPAAKAMLSRARDQGINTIDCADVYGKGAAETLLGRLLGQDRADLVVCSKAYFPTGKGENDRGSSRFHLVRAVEASLRRLRTDRLDLFFLHRFDDLTLVDDTMRALDDLVRAGKILYLGASNFAAWQVQKANGIAERDHLSKLVCVQPMYNLAKRQAEVEILPMAAADRIGVMAYGPTGGGLLTGKYGVDKRPTSGRLVSNAMYATRYAATTNYEIADRFTRLASERGQHPATLAVAWAMNHWAMTSVIIGARNVEQLEPSLQAADLEVDRELMSTISALSPTPAPSTDRNEESSEHNYGAR